MNEQTLFKTWELTPLQEVEVNASGRFLYVEQCDGPVSIALDDGSAFKIRSGFEFANRDFRKFRLISNVGPGGATVTVRIYSGNIYVSNRNPVVYVRPIPFYVVASEQVLGAGGSYNVPFTNLRPGQTVPDRVVKVRLENNSVNNAVDVKVGAVRIAVLSAVILGAQYKETFEIQEPITIYSGGGATVLVTAFYELPS